MTETSRPAPVGLASEEYAVLSPRHRVDRRFILWRTLNALFWGLGVVGVLVTLYALFDSIRTWLLPIILVVGAIYLVNLAVMPTWRYLVHRWETSDEAVYVLQGWLTREWRIIPISRIQRIDTERGPLQQVLGLATVKVVTASSEGGITIEGLDVRVAEDTVRHLNKITQATPGDAT
ncbi:PH domain-containing protein [Actinosynnema sp. NPDC047251]|uniref:Membrane-flanked domain-containing protein n=1 Tax=Saccharothrix espanaensis (strain ATCC 51144 / DSM 44229 / JCM 9112 / NBRC 15066 / NRRL 15764) TaxID=1179773 RepID=K0K6L1_SACES|nr:PH domain-containing protein [Saccharothrix espanaensis]CCH33142.1 membrane-flanked domain-containing protein [Saccharothrix espanaensis DSM 44229]